MSPRSDSVPVLPEATARVAKATFHGNDNIYLTIGDKLDWLLNGIDFGRLYAAGEEPPFPPYLLALVTVFQCMESLSEREAANAVRSRIDWKYALHLPLEDRGFDATVLADFRARLSADGTAQALFDVLMERLNVAC